MPDTLFYDGGCGLCHRFVSFVARRDRGERFLFAPLGGEHFRAQVSEQERQRLPETLVLRTADGRLLTRSSAVLAALRALGGIWRAVAAVAVAIPAPVRDGVYDFVARIRYRLFGRPAQSCPLLPLELRQRFLP